MEISTFVSYYILGIKEIKFSLFPPLLFSLLYEESNGHVESYGTVDDQGKKVE